MTLDTAQVLSRQPLFTFLINIYTYETFKLDVKKTKKTNTSFGKWYPGYIRQSHALFNFCELLGFLDLNCILVSFVERILRAWKLEEVDGLISSASMCYIYIYIYICVCVCVGCV